MKFTSLLFTLTLILFTSLTFAPKPSAKTALKVLKGFCEYVPSGNAVVEGDTSSVQAFYMSATEITNFQYNEFLWHLKKNGEMEKYEIAKIDTMAWNTTFTNGHMEPMTSHYHDHPAYRNYPVVNISKEGAELYCQWLTEVYDSISGGELKLKFRIPKRAEYLRAARGDHHIRTYAWGGPYVRNSEGQFLANFVANGAECVTRNKETGKLQFIQADYHELQFHRDDAYLTAPAKSYWPNEFGIYNLNGNVAEMISDGNWAVGGSWYSPGYDIRNESIEEFDKPHPTIGFRVVVSYLEPVK